MNYFALKRSSINFVSGITKWFWNIRLKPYKTHISYNISEIFDGKKVAIIGAADSALNTNLSAYLNSFDVIVRINRGVFLADNKDLQNYIGDRTDVLMTYENLVKYGAGEDDKIFKSLRSQKVKHIIVTMLWHKFPTRQIYNFFQSYFSKLPQNIKIYFYSSKERQRLKKLLNGKIATTGFAAIASVLASNFAECYITGFTFFKTEYAQGYRSNATSKDTVLHYIKKTGLHDADQEYEVFKKLIQKDRSKIILDEFLTSLIDS